MTSPIARQHDLALSMIPNGPSCPTNQPKRKSNMLAFSNTLHHQSDSPLQSAGSHNHHHYRQNQRTASSGFLAIRNGGSKLKLLRRAQSSSPSSTNANVSPI